MSVETLGEIVERISGETTRVNFETFSEEIFFGILWKTPEDLQQEFM